jgi:hypothetical protein
MACNREEGARFESQSGHRLSWLRIFFDFLSYFIKIPGQGLKLGQIHPIIRRRSVWPDESVVK